MPSEIHGNLRVSSITFQRTRLKGEPLACQATPGPHTVKVDCGLIVGSVGYRAPALKPLQLEVIGACLQNSDGRLTRDRTVIPGLYVTGWLKRGPQGTIGTNRADSVATVALVLDDLEEVIGKTPKCPVEELLARLESRGALPVSCSHWKAIDAHERSEGQKQGRPRVKLATVKELLAVAYALPLRAGIDGK